MRKILLIPTLLILILTSAPAMAGGGETGVDPIANLTFSDRVVYFLDHTSDPAEGNWINLGGSDAVERIQLPQPIKLTYSGPKYKEYSGVSGTLNKGETESYTITYPSTAPYLTHPIYLPDQNVSMSFYGESGLVGEVEIYLFKVNSECAYDLIDAFNAGNIDNLNSLFHDNMDGHYEEFTEELGANGDLLDYDFGPLDAGQYCIVLCKENEDGSLTVLSTTAFLVAKYDLQVSASNSIVKGEDLDVNVALNGADESGYTYGAVLIRDQAYKANIEINSDGTKNGTSIIVNEVDLIEEFDINSSNYRSKLNKNELQTEIQTLIGEGKGAIAIGETGDTSLSLTAFDLPVGSYYLLVGAYSSEEGLVGLAQLEMEIEQKGRSGGSSSGGGGGGGSPEPAKNVKTKELCQQFIANGNRIRFEFTRKATCIGYLEFNAKKTAGKTTATIEELKGKSVLTPTEPEGEIYKHLNIWVGNGGFANSNNIENAVVGFGVSKAWIAENNIIMDSIALQHFSENEWNSLPTKKVGEDEEYIYFEAETPGFSPFAITGREVIAIEENGGEKEIQSSTQTMQEVETESPVEAETTLKGKISPVISKMISFFAGFLVIILVGMGINEKRKK